MQIRKIFLFLFLVPFFLVLCISSNLWADTKFANDPTLLSIGARVLGLGNSFVGLADDTSAIFINPAGLSKIDHWQISSTSGKYLNFYDYAQFSALFPTFLGTLGIAYGGTAVSFHYPSAEVIMVGDEIRYLPTGEVSGKYSNTALLLSYGKKVDILFFKNLGLGASIKLLSQDLSFTGASGNGKGMEANFGIYYPVAEELSLGLAIHNALPSAVGGKVTWSTNTEETLPAMMKAGLAYQLKPLHLTISGDYDYQLTRTDFPNLLHFGAEWNPISFLALRAGLDQGVGVSTLNEYTVANDLSLGLGLIFRGFRFDYAYHTFDNVAENTTHYFSLTYGLPGEKEEVATKEYLSIMAPTEGALFYDGEIEIKGVVAEGVEKVLVNGLEAELKEDGTFTTRASLELGRNEIKIEGFDRGKKLLKQMFLGVTRLISFKDVAEGYWARKEIGELATLKVIGGYPDGTFRPEEPVVRAELVALLVRSEVSSFEGLGEIKFKDVSSKHWAAKYIMEAVKRGWVKGYADNTFQPGKAISRAEGAEILAKFGRLAEPKEKFGPYGDLPGRHWAAKAVLSLKEAGVLDFIKEDKFYPRQSLKRSEVAYLLAKIPLMRERIKKELGVSE